MTNTLRLRYILGSITITALLIIGYISGIYTKMAMAAISIFSPSTCYTNLATTSPAYMTPGTATSTVSCNLGIEGAKAAVLTVQVNATSTNTLYKVFVEESWDGIDYYPVSMNQTASTTGIGGTFDASVGGSISYKFASTTTINGAGVGASTSLGVNGTNNRNHFEVDIPVRLRYVRAYAVLPSPPITNAATSSYNGAIWMQILPRQDIN